MLENEIKKKRPKLVIPVVYPKEIDRYTNYVSVMCPFCDRIHKHSISLGIYYGGNRLSKCEDRSRRYYEIFQEANAKKEYAKKLESIPVTKG